MNLETNIAGVKLGHPIFNAAGLWCVFEDELEALANSKSAATLVKSASVSPREGNPEPRYAEFGGLSINSVGIANLGYKKYLELFQKLKGDNKPLVASVSGMSLDENIEILKAYSNSDSLDLIELNLSCPNLAGKSQVGYDFEASRKYLDATGENCQKKWGIKLPPYFDMAHYQAMADLINSSKASFVVCCNTLGNGLVIDSEKESVVIKPNDGFGGIGGSIAKPFGLAGVRKFRELLNDDISIVGVGGIQSGQDVFEYILAGADAVQLGTVIQKEGLGAFGRILSEFQDIKKRKNYKNINEFKSKLKIL